MASPSDLLVASNRDQITMLPRDPKHAYVFWEVTSAGLADAQNRVSNSSEARLLCRVLRRVIDDQGQSVDLEVVRFEVGDSFDGRFVDFSDENVDHWAEVGLLTAEQEFLSIARSEPITAPRTVAGLDAPHFVAVELTGDGLVTADTDHRHPKGGYFPARQRSYSGSTSLPRRND
ncbi:MAG: DUF4912 domain-containing protein [Bradymonadaceae bacterium]|nr:DUF4912 domain-containing protein [Lujinxingiaceae bacterium]